MNLSAMVGKAYFITPEADHNSYHIDQLILLRGYLGIWRDE